MKFAVLQFPGSNCDHDCVHSIQDDCGFTAELVWHQEPALPGFDAIIIPGGFAHGDYLRCGAMAKHSPVMKAVREAAGRGVPVLGICNGFQILCEAGLLPGALVRNRSLHYICEFLSLRVETTDSPFTAHCHEGQLLRMPIGHGEGCFYADETTLDELEANHQVLLRYVDAETGEATEQANPNGSKRNIAGICNRERNVFGLMPHPDRASNLRLGSADGRFIFESMAEAMAGAKS